MQRILSGVDTQKNVLTSWPDKVSYSKVLQSANTQRELINTIEKLLILVTY